MASCRSPAVHASTLCTARPKPPAFAVSQIVPKVNCRSTVARCSLLAAQRQGNRVAKVLTTARQSSGEVYKAVLTQISCSSVVIQTLLAVQSATALAPDMTKTKVLFVCLGEQHLSRRLPRCQTLTTSMTSTLYAGNICRSPTAEAVFKKVVDRSGVADEFVIDSCGTGGGSEEWYASHCSQLQSTHTTH